MDENLALLLAGILTFIFGWNNSSILIGNQRGSGTLTGLQSTALCSIGMILGVAIQGSQMHGSLTKTISSQASDPIILATMAISIALTLVLTLASIPVAFSITMVGAFLGAAFASSTIIRGEDVATIVLFWAGAPLATMAVTFVAYRAIERATANISLLSVDAFDRAGVVLVSLALAYVLSANNIGLIYGTAFGSTQSSGSITDLLILAAVAIVAMALFGRGNVAGTVGDRLLSLSPQGVLAAFTGTIVMMWLATQLSIPVSITQCLIGGMLGAAFTKRISIINRRILLEVVASWVVIPVVAFALAALLVPVF